MVDLNKCLVTVGGEIQVEATAHAVVEACINYNENRANDLDVIGTAVHAVFAQYPGVFVPVPSVKTLTLGELKPTGLKAMAVVTERIGDYLTANSVEDGIVWIKKGEGCRLVSDLTEKELAQRAASFAAAKAKAAAKANG